MKDPDGFSRASDVLQSLFDRIITSGGKQYTGLVSGWKRIVGPELAFHAVPKDVVNHVLIVETDHPGWSQRLRMEQRRILAVLKATYPDLGISRLRVVVGDGLSPPAESPPPTGRNGRKPAEKEAPVPAPMDVGGQETQDFRQLLERLKRLGNP